MPRTRSSAKSHSRSKTDLNSQVGTQTPGCWVYPYPYCTSATIIFFSTGSGCELFSPMVKIVSRGTSVPWERNQRGQRAGSEADLEKGDKKGVKRRWARARCAEILLDSCVKYDRLNMQHPCKAPIFLLLPPPTTVYPFSLPHPPVPWHLCTKATQRITHTHIENRISMSLPWPWGEVSNISFQGDNDSSFNSPYFTVCPNEYTAWVILIEHQPASGIMTLTVLSRFDDLMTMDLLIYPEICSTSFIKT